MTGYWKFSATYIRAVFACDVRYKHYYCLVWQHKRTIKEAKINNQYNQNRLSNNRLCQLYARVFLFNPFKLNGFSHSYQLDQCISFLRWWFFFWKLDSTSLKQTWHLVWVCSVCLCPTKRTICLCGLIVCLFEFVSTISAMSGYYLRWTITRW